MPVVSREHGLISAPGGRWGADAVQTSGANGLASSLKEPFLAEKEKARLDRGHSNHTDFDITVNPNYKTPGYTICNDEKGWHLGKGWVDECFTLGLMVFCFVWSILYRKIGRWLWKFAVDQDFELITVLKFANDVTQVTMYLLLFGMWLTLCYRCRPLHERVWKWHAWFLPSMMSGGFAPRPTALSLGVLMFATSTLFDIDVVQGKDLLDKTQWASNKWEQCRATDLEVANRGSMWFSRFYRHAPAQRGYTCYGVDEYDLLGYVFTSHRFTHADIEDYMAQHNDSAPPGLIHAAYNDSHILLDGSLPQRFLNAIDEYMPAPNISTKDCMYQCVKWRQVSFLKFIKNIGLIASGCGIVVKGTEYLTQVVGETMGGLLVTSDTSAKSFGKLVKMRYMDGNEGCCSRLCCMQCCVRSKSFCALFLAALVLGPLAIAPRIDIDGYYTEDFYVTSVFLASVLISLLVRMWSPYLGEPIHYTKTMWKEGSDSFIKISQYDDVPLEKQSIDLYEWVHLTYRQRANHLHMYARAVSMKQVNKATLEHKAQRDGHRVYVIRATSEPKGSEKGGKQAQISLEQSGINTCKIIYKDIEAEALSLRVGDAEYSLQGNTAQGEISKCSFQLHGNTSIIGRDVKILGIAGSEISSGKIELMSHWLKVTALDDFEHLDWRRRKDGNRTNTRFTTTVSRGAEGVVVNKTDTGKAVVLWFADADENGDVLVETSTDKDCRIEELLTNEEKAWNFVQADVDLDKIMESSKEWSAVRVKFHLRHARCHAHHPHSNA